MEVEAERVERPEPAVDRRRPADRHDHPADAGVERCAEQLPGPERRRGERVVRAGHERQAAGARHLDHGRVAAQAPLGVDRLAERAADPRGAAVGVAGAEDVERALASVRQGEAHRRAAGALHARGQRVRRLGRGQASTELVGTAQDGP